LAETFLILRRVERDIKSVYCSSCKVPIIQNFLNIFSMNSQVSKFLKMCSVGAELFHAVRQTDRLTWRSL
jgi:RNase P subunit RPR2